MTIKYELERKVEEYKGFLIAGYDVISVKQTVEECDKYDYIIAASCGVIAGLVDVFFVGAPGQSVLQGTVNGSIDSFVKKAAQAFYKFDQRSIKNKKMPKTLEQCISYLEQAFPVPYDARYAKDLKNAGKNRLAGMNPKNHHLLSLSHSPDIFGLIFSIIDQFTDMGSYIDNGRLIRLEPKKSSGAIPYLQGNDTISKFFCGFVNWIGHIISDMAGSSSVRRKGGKSSGVSIPFYELFLGCDFGNIDGNTIAEIATKAFEEGYNLNWGLTMAIPVVLNDLFIRLIWSLKKHFYAGKDWKQCIPTNDHDDLRIMLLVGQAAMCLVDGIDAFIRSGGNALLFVSRINLIAWGKLTYMALKELVIRYKYLIDAISQPYKLVNEAMTEYLKGLENIDFEAFRRESEALESFCKKMLATCNEEDLNRVLIEGMKDLGFELPWEGDFDDFMSNPKNCLEFGKMK